MELIGFLILFPLLAAVILLFIKNDSARKVVVGASAAIIAIASLALVIGNLSTPPIYYEFDSQIVEIICVAISIAIGLVVLWFAYKYKNILAGVLAAIQLVGSLIFDFAFAPNVHVAQGLYLDSLSVMMTFIIGIIGSGICFYALGYMKDHVEHHPDEEDRRPLFFFLMFLFLSAMYVIVFSNNMVWMFTGWEVTTLCSFLLIGYTKTDEAIANSFRQIVMNIAGGIGFLIALFYCAGTMNTLSFIEFIQLGLSAPAVISLPVCALAFAGITKAAQMPFHSWLLGAMVAPTPTSALLHSSTMVKAGVFLLVKLAPLFAIATAPAVMVVLVGGITFALASFMAISQSNAKRVLAYSTIANLGLIVACAGVGTPEAVWAAMFLILFHAAAKSLLFLCVGTAEHHIGSRDIEDMDLLFERMPQLARNMMIGIMIMFIAPFGMLISKWATLVSFVDNHQVALIILLAFGSAATFMFWAKWLGKLSGVAGQPANVETTVHKTEWVAIYLMTVLALIFCIGLPLISSTVVMPYINGVYGYTMTALDTDILALMSILSIAVIVLLLAGTTGASSKRKVDAYLAGISVSNADRSFRNSLSQETRATVRNMYLADTFGEERITPVAEISTTLIIIGSFAAALATVISML
ncbi:MAG: NADH-quinone oxidoreductase subunit L [Eggerthellaceae bacterium]|nr:NADH-quinone oxidoreductase subunit L [Eggerthellaceae bacterium]